MKILRKPKKPGSQSDYFTQDTENAIVAFQNSKTRDEKQDIFNDKIKRAFEKLVENIIFVYKFNNLEELDVLKNDCLSFLFENLNKFDHTRGHKAFSYFNVIAKHWFIQKAKKYKRRAQENVCLDSELLKTLEKESRDMIVDPYETDYMEKEFLLLLKEEVKGWRKKIDKQQEKMVLEAIILLLDNPELISDLSFNKKGIYLYMREIANLNTKQIVSNLMKFKKKYQLFKKRYHAGDV